MSTQVSTHPVNTQPSGTPDVVVGIDSADHRTGAVLWACQQAARHHLPVRLVSACHSIGVPRPGRREDTIAGDAEGTVRTSLSRLAARLSGDMQIEMLPVQVATGSPRTVLLEAVGDETRLLVVGRHAPGAAAHLLGSTSLAVAGRSPVPVVVVPDSWVTTSRSSAPVVVGTMLGAEAEADADADRAVLRYAFDAARDLRVPLIVVHAWEVPALYGWSPIDIADFRGRISNRLEERLTAWREDYPEVEVVATTVAESAVDAVLDASRVAQLAVVGRHTPASRHRGLRLGSTARGVLHRADTPVAVIPLESEHPHGHGPSHLWGPMF